MPCSKRLKSHAISGLRTRRTKSTVERKSLVPCFCYDNRCPHLSPPARFMEDLNRSTISRELVVCGTGPASGPDETGYAYSRSAESFTSITCSQKKIAEFHTYTLRTMAAIMLLSERTPKATTRTCLGSLRQTFCQHVARSPSSYGTLVM